MLTVLAPSIGAFLIGATIMAKVFSQEEIDILNKSLFILYKIKTAEQRQQFTYHHFFHHFHNIQ